MNTGTTTTVRPSLFIQLAGFLPPLLLTVSALWPVHLLFAPGPLLAFPLYLAAASVGMGLSADSRVLAVLGRQLRGGYWLALASLVGLGATLYLPVARLLAGGSLLAVLAVGAIVGCALVVLWRGAILPVLLLESRAEPIREQRRSMEEEPLLGRDGWIAAVNLLLLMLTTLAVTWSSLWPPLAYRVVILLYAVVLAPLLAWLTLAAGRRQLERARRRVADVVVERAIAVPAPPRREAIMDIDAELYAAARAGRIEEALALLDAGANPRALPAHGGRDQRSLIMLAAVQPDLRLLRALIAAGVDLNQGRAGLTPLMAAVRDSYHGRPDAVLMLLANGADPRVTDSNGATPLHAAARALDPAIAALLLDAGASLDALDAQGISPLGVAAGLGNLEVARFLLTRRAACEPPGGEPALLLAASREDDDPAMLALLLRHKAKVDARGRLGRTALHGACLHRNLRLVDALLEARAQPDLPDDLGVTPLLEAARAGAVACVTRLGERGGVDPAACDHAGRNALAIACQTGGCDSATVKALLDLGVDPQQVANDGRRAIDHAVAAGRWAHVALLDPGYVLPACLAEDDEELRDAPPLVRLRLALERGSVASARDLLPLAIATPAELVALLLDLAPRLQHASACVLTDTLDVNAARADGSLLIWQMLALGPVADCTLLALFERAVTPVGRGSLARYLDAALLHAGPAPRSRQVAHALLERGADPFAADTGGPPLHLALRLGWHDLVDTLLARGVDPESRDRYGTSALMLACQLDDATMVRRLLTAGAQPTSRAPDGQTAQGQALTLERAELARWMDWPRWRLPRRPLRDDDVVAAAQAGDGPAVERLLELGLALDATDAQGCTALLRACGGGHVELVRQLLARGSDPARSAHSGATCLSVALTARQQEVVQVLARHGVAIDQRLPGGITALMIAAALGQDEAIKDLLAHGADPGAVDAHGGSALHALGHFGFGTDAIGPAVASWEALLAAGADPDAANAGGETPLLLLLGASFEPGTGRREDVILAQLEVLLQEGVNLALRERRGFGALHLASLHGLGAVVQRLLTAGADPGLRDVLNRRPAEIALMRGYVDIAAAFVPGAPAPSIARFLREPRN